MQLTHNIQQGGQGPSQQSQQLVQQQQQPVQQSVPEPVETSQQEQQSVQQQQQQQQQVQVQQIRRQRKGYVSILEDNFTFNVPDETLNGLFDTTNKKKLFNESKKRELVKRCAEQLFLNREEFYYRRQNDIMKKALSGILPDASDNHISILVTAINDYRRNHWTKKGKPYHNMWKQEKKYKNLDFRESTTFQATHKKKTDTHGKPKAIMFLKY